MYLRTSVGAEAGAPFGAVELGGLGLVEEALEDRGEAAGALLHRDVAGVGEDLEPAAGQLGVGGAAVGDRDDRVALAPDDQDRQASAR